MSDSKILKIGLPKGSLEETTFALFRKAGFSVTLRDRSYKPSIDDPELSGMMIRAQEIARYVEVGAIDCGLTGWDWVVENNAKVKVVSDLIYAKRGTGIVKWVLAVPEASDIKSVKDLEGKRIATELVKGTQRFLKKHGVKCNVEFSWGATEVKVPDLADAIVDVTETGSSLRANKLRIVETILESNTKFISNNQAWEDPWKRQKMLDMNLLLQGALEAESKVGLKMNLPTGSLDAIVSVLPAMKNPTVSPLSDGKWIALEVVVEEKQVRDLIPQLKKAGACDIIEYKLTKVIH